MDAQRLTVAEWFKEDGDFVEVGDKICVLESEEASVEITAWESGLVRRLMQRGESFRTGVDSFVKIVPV